MGTEGRMGATGRLPSAFWWAIVLMSLTSGPALWPTGPAGPFWSASKEDPAAREIFEGMVRAYASARAYEGSGVAILYRNLGGPLTFVRDYAPFEIRFERPRRFRFDWFSDNPYPDKRGRIWHDVVWSDGAGSHTYFLGRKGEARDLRLALAGASGGAPPTRPGLQMNDARTVPELLMEEIGGYGLRQIQNLVLLGRETFEGEACDVLRGENTNGFIYEIWISRKDRSLRLERTWGGTTIMDQIHRDVRFDGDLPDDAFRFQPSRWPQSGHWPQPGMFAFPGLVLLGFGAFGLWRRKPLVMEPRRWLYGLLVPYLLPVFWANGRWLLREGGRHFVDVGALGFLAACLIGLLLIWWLRAFVIIGITSEAARGALQHALENLNVAFEESPLGLRLTNQPADFRVDVWNPFVGTVIFCLRPWHPETLSAIRREVARELEREGVRANALAWVPILACGAFLTALASVYSLVAP